MCATGDDGYFAYFGEYVVSVSAILGNALLGMVVSYAADYYGFTYKRNMQIVYLVTMAFFNAFMVNLFEFFVVMQQSTLKVSPSLPNDFVLNYGMRIAMDDLYTMLIPMYVCLPYIGEPLLSIWFAYWIGIFRIKTDTRITPAQAEMMMQSAEMDVVNTPYNDLLCITASFMVVFLAPTRTHVELFGWLMFFSVFTYIQARKRFLSWNTFAELGDKSLHDTMSYLWALPMALLAANMGSNMSTDSASSSEQQARGSASMGVVCALVHVIIHVVFVRFVIPCTGRYSRVPNETYLQALQKRQGATYLNTNPVEVLLSRQETAATGGTGLTFYSRGKEYLQYDRDLYYQSARGSVYGMKAMLAEYTPGFVIGKPVDKE
eukprot:TRINITY_DN18607_c0_g1_i1.p1 TRINITY_DN18607_c0_g1~~TRINITY_DN18607_c0_g1_i1.p1  ORF type:complete len:394 (-),score=38.89 TRINITY_DN18607_c0_g1_i1:161-1288(-)